MRKIMMIMLLLVAMLLPNLTKVNARYNMLEDGTFVEAPELEIDNIWPFVVGFSYDRVTFLCDNRIDVKSIKVYRATSIGGKYTYLGKCDNDGMFTAKKLVCGKEYFFKWVTTYNSGRKTEFITIARAELFPIPYITRTSSKMIWNKVKGAHGYIIYRANKGSKTLKKIGSTTKTSYAASKKYDYYVKPYRKVNSKYVYGDMAISQALK